MGNVLDLCDPPRRTHPNGEVVSMVSPTVLVSVPKDARRRALIIGINYYGQGKAELDGCVSDAKRMREFLEGKGFSDVRMLTDEAEHQGTSSFANRVNILVGMKWLVYGAKPGDSLFFFFAGHGCQVKDTDGDEVDGLDETILPSDHRIKGQIVDDVMFEILIKPLPAGCRLTAVMDCCHSGTGLDLPFGLCPSKTSWKTMQERRKMSQTESIDEYEDTLQPLTNYDYSNRLCDADVLLLSGCADEETSADTTDVREITSAFDDNPPITFTEEDLLPLNANERPPTEKEEYDFLASMDDGEDWFTNWYSGPKKRSVNTTKRRSSLAVRNEREANARLRPHDSFIGSAVKGRAGGALTTAFIVLIKSIEERGKTVKYSELLYGLREVLDQLDFTQNPQLSGSKPFKMNSVFQL